MILRAVSWVLVGGLVVGLARAPAADSCGWTDLIGSDPWAAWDGLPQQWTIAGDAALDAKNPRRLVPKPGSGVLVNGAQGGKTQDLTSKQSFGDVELHVEFMIPQGSNSGVKLQGLYEIQIADSHGVERPTASQCGGIYPRAELRPRYHTIDEGTPPRLNAARPPGQWQSLDVVFRAPRFDGAGNKTANARMVKVVLNGQVIHENVELKWPTRHAWRKVPEAPCGPILLQADHGPVAFRNVRVRAHGG